MGNSQEFINAFYYEATADDYNHLLQTVIDIWTCSKMELKMDFISLITSEKRSDRINMIRGDKNFVQKVLAQTFNISKPEIQNIFDGFPLERSGRKFVAHENFNSLYLDIERLKSIQSLLMDVERHQIGEHVQILRDTVVRIEKTIQNICQDFSE